ncbi:Peptidase C11, clostripain [Thermoplasmatales archaeon SCGC AB-539-N05]|nr:Peptidase C11, clostripain [Thermoplasmatales archaeon SCGC AB-539-N05]
MKKNNKIIVFLTILVLVSSGTLTSANIIQTKNDNFNEKEKFLYSNFENIIANWTLMHYLSFDNHHVSYEIDIKMENFTKIGSSDDFNLIVASDGEEYGDSSIYYVEQDDAVKINNDFNWPEEVDMGNPNTVKSFINLVKQNYPAKHYAIIFYTDCGSGWQGVLRDTDGGNDSGFPLMTIPMLAEVFKDVTEDGSDKFDVVGIMTCLSGSLEIAYELSPYVKYIVFSEEHMLEPLDKGPEYIFQYVKTTWNLKNNTNMTPEEYAKSLVDYFKPCYFPLWVFYIYEIIYKKGEISPLLKALSNVLTKILNNRKNPDCHIANIDTTLSTINLSRLGNVKNSLNKLTSELILYIEDEDIKNAISNARKNVRSYGHFYPKNQEVSKLAMIFLIEKLMFDSYVDLYNLVDLIYRSVENNEIKNLCLQLMDQINYSVVKKTSMPSDNSNGFSIYFPKEKNLYNKYIWNDEFNPEYENLKFSKDTPWDEFLKTYLDI